MKFSESERLILANQYKILHELSSQKNDGSKEIYNQLIEIFNNGYTNEYNLIEENQFVPDTAILDIKGQSEVRDLISMYQFLLNSYDSAKEKFNDLPEIKFVGYDLNNNYEAHQLSYMDYILDTLNQYNDVKKAFGSIGERNSHGATHAHDEMLAKFKELKDKGVLYDDSKNSVKQILDKQ
ncbi:YfbU family protein [Leuconostoc citreum]|jgi:uncharacterized protein YfbU (UPF0304 family)|uniref:YfbU family protein n=1 Tax=Leuconostoc citreum TaxID=33964 RepID=UPI0028039580|nr:YfbU family protein [uncultured Leuconostoc sp.]MDU7281951.1 YfbU family protein [Leuconostoc citreum]